ncbi:MULTISPECIES: rhombosortase [unclassified Arsukibacterium]|uniref:rhombosortase n=1 Tax=unclassified Arsukibacterium TaxID=2635278 RepID=UPI000C97141B|nr:MULTISPECIES: rhombosortase [unclassified Arsukibacterium]MAA93235.1 rhombosortase [Rheinheimera sp.]HAW92710.1 rhombosortase [Candidatus Azambacteria bacterium]|tara:strand:- start:29166 stop:29765 length:600 start_codon:yes stop_codon:yes gene_type:complete
MQALFYAKPGFGPCCLLLLLVILAFLLPESIQHIFAYQRVEIASGEVWRLISGHLLHSNLYHLLLNGGGLLVIMLLHAGYQRQLALIWQLLFNALFISGMMYWLQADIQRYVGLSGVLHGMLFFGALLDIKTGKTGGMLLTLGILAKIGYEQYQGPDLQLSQLISATVAIDAHLYGVIAGALLFSVVLFRRWLQKKPIR